MSVEFEKSEATLATIATLADADKIRVISGGSSRNISTTSFVSSIEDNLRSTHNFLTSTTIDTKVKVVVKAAAYTMQLTDGLVKVDATTAAFDLTLPDVTDMYNTVTGISYLFRVHNVTPSAGNDVTLKPSLTSAAALLNDGASYIMTSGSYPGVEIYSDGTDYFII